MKETKNVVITGGNSGIGYETARGLYKDGHNVVFGSRNQQKNEEAVNEIKKEAGGSIRCFPLDLSKRESIDKFAKEVLSLFSHVDNLINNAGVSLFEREVSELGIELTLTANYFGHFYLTYLLFDSIKKAKEGRIINVSSYAHFWATDNFLDDLAFQKNWNNMDAYANSKLFNVLFSVGLNNLFKEKNIQNIKTASVHPGVVDSNLASDSCMLQCLKCICCCMFVKKDEGARTNLHLCRIPFQEIRSGEYYDNDTQLKEMNKKGRDMSAVRKLWEISEKAYGIKFD